MNLHAFHIVLSVNHYIFMSITLKCVTLYVIFLENDNNLIRLKTKNDILFVSPGWRPFVILKVI